MSIETATLSVTERRNVAGIVSLVASTISRIDDANSHASFLPLAHTHALFPHTTACPFTLGGLDTAVTHSFFISTVILVTQINDETCAAVFVYTTAAALTLGRTAIADTASFIDIAAIKT